MKVSAILVVTQFFWVSPMYAASALLQSCLTLCDPRRHPTRVPHPWDSPGKNTGVGCHFLLQCMKVKGESEIAQSCPTLSDPMNCRSPGSSIHGIFQARVLEWGAIAFSMKNSIQFRSVQSLSHVQLFVIPWTVAGQTPPSMGFPRQEYWSGLPFPFPIDADTFKNITKEHCCC